MVKKYLIGVSAVLFIIIVEWMIYLKQETGVPRLIRCYPTSQINTFKNLGGRMAYDSIYLPITDFTLRNTNDNMVINDSLKDEIHIPIFSLSLQNYFPENEK